MEQEVEQRCKSLQQELELRDIRMAQLGQRHAADQEKLQAARVNTQAAQKELDDIAELWDKTRRRYGGLKGAATKLVSVAGAFSNPSFGLFGGAVQELQDCLKEIENADEDP